MILLIDNYDSFSYNLYQLVGEISNDIIKIVRNNKITCDEISEFSPSHIIISPGPGRPADAGVCEMVISEFSGLIPILGVCLGHQAICEVFGAKIGYANQIMHGKTSDIKIDNLDYLFKELPKQIVVGRYHSLVAIPHTMPSSLKVIAKTISDEIMAVKHIDHPKTYGLQFHPESILTPYGKKILTNFLELQKEV
ncbi:MAG: aminodeoxychorismate/anthranilate synthase component II [Christensenellaceae bacterium]|jgi:anthranilate synthase component 2|nr:aminodeoxychorismate/anthranilate synthase component II [Christensenellaceae bacterium]